MISAPAWCTFLIVSLNKRKLLCNDNRRKEINFMEEIKLETLKKDLEEYQKDSKNAVLRHALTATPLSQVAASQDEVKDINFNFDIEIKTLSAANQKASGRCWIFAATNVLREIIAKKLNLKEFELSQSY